MSRVAELVGRFEACTLPLTEFRHAEHLQVALWYALRHPMPEAMARMREGLQCLLKQHHILSAYSEQTTLYWMQTVSRYAVEADTSRPIDELASDLVRLYAK